MLEGCQDRLRLRRRHVQWSAQADLLCVQISDLPERLDDARGLLVVVRLLRPYARRRGVFAGSGARRTLRRETFHSGQDGLVCTRYAVQRPALRVRRDGADRAGDRESQRCCCLKRRWTSTRRYSPNTAPGCRRRTTQGRLRSGCVTRSAGRLRNFTCCNFKISMCWQPPRPERITLTLSPVSGSASKYCPCSTTGRDWRPSAPAPSSHSSFCWMR